MNYEIPLGKPFLGKEEKDAVLDIIDSKKIATGDTVKAFEDEFKTKIGREYCVTVNSGTVALYIALRASNLKGYVIIPTITCIDVLNAVLCAGLKPIFADVEADTQNIDLSTVSEKSLKDATGIIITHTYGHSVDIEELDYYLSKYKLMLIEDFSQAVGGCYKNKSIGSLGDISITSFYGPKNMTTGHGGAILSDDKVVYNKCKCLRAKGDCAYFDLIPLNNQMTDIQAAIGLVQLRKLNKMVEMRRNAAKMLTQKLNNVNIKLPIEKKYAKHTYYKYQIVLPQEIDKVRFREEMKKLRIQTGGLYDPPLHKTEISINISKKNIKLPIAEELSPRTVSLPMFPELTRKDVERICRGVNYVINHVKRIDKKGI